MWPASMIVFSSSAFLEWKGIIKFDVFRMKCESGQELSAVLADAFAESSQDILHL
jgi:hypothetical protein